MFSWLKRNRAVEPEKVRGTFSGYAVARTEKDARVSIDESKTFLPVSGLRTGDQVIPLQVVLNGDANLRRARHYTRVGLESCRLLQNWLEVGDTIDAQSVLSAGMAASELGVGVLRARAPRGANAMEELRLLRAACHRFSLSLVLKVKSEDEGYLVAPWCNALELSSLHLSKTFLRKISELGLTLVIRRDETEDDIRSFIIGCSFIRSEFTNAMVVVDEVRKNLFGRYTFDQAALSSLATEAGIPVILDVKSTITTRGEQETNSLSSIGSGASGVVIAINSGDELELSENFQDYYSLLKKLTAMRYTMEALRHL